MENLWMPWVDYPQLTGEALCIVADVIRKARRDTLALYDPMGGDNAWSHGCRAYVRSVFALENASKKYPWLTVLPELERLRSTFAIAGVPFRFYRGSADDPPTHYLATTFAEVKQLQWALKLDGLRPIDRILRIAVETDSEGNTTDVTLVEVDEAGNVTNSYRVPPSAEPTNVIPALAPPIDLPAPQIEPKSDEARDAQDHDKKKQNG